MMYFNFSLFISFFVYGCNNYDNESCGMSEKTHECGECDGSGYGEDPYTSTSQIVDEVGSSFSTVFFSNIESIKSIDESGDTSHEEISGFPVCDTPFLLYLYIIDKILKNDNQNNIKLCTEKTQCNICEYLCKYNDEAHHTIDISKYCGKKIMDSLSWNGRDLLEEYETKLIYHILSEKKYKNSIKNLDKYLQNCISRNLLFCCINYADRMKDDVLRYLYLEYKDLEYKKTIELIIDVFSNDNINCKIISSVCREYCYNLINKEVFDSKCTKSDRCVENYNRIRSILQKFKREFLSGTHEETREQIYSLLVSSIDSIFGCECVLQDYKPESDADKSQNSKKKSSSDLIVNQCRSNKDSKVVSDSSISIKKTEKNEESEKYSIILGDSFYSSALIYHNIPDLDFHFKNLNESAIAVFEENFMEEDSDQEMIKSKVDYLNEVKYCLYLIDKILKKDKKEGEKICKNNIKCKICDKLDKYKEKENYSTSIFAHCGDFLGEQMIDDIFESYKLQNYFENDYDHEKKLSDALGGVQYEDAIDEIKKKSGDCSIQKLLFFCLAYFDRYEKCNIESLVCKKVYQNFIENFHQLIQYIENEAIMHAVYKKYFDVLIEFKEKIFLKSLIHAKKTYHTIMKKK